MIEHRIDMFRYRDEIEALQAQEINPNAILFYGSSTIARWDNLVADMAPRLINKRGFGGSTSDEGLFHYDTLARVTQPKIVVWYFGDNEPVCGYTVDETFTLFKLTWERFRTDNPEVKIVVIKTKTSPARDEYAPFVKELNRRVSAFVGQTRGFYEVSVDDICKKDGKYLLENYYSDQLHFSEKGYSLLAKKVKKVLDEIEG